MLQELHEKISKPFQLKRPFYIQGLNFMRFVAAMAVLVFHSTHSTQVGALSPFKQLLKNLVVGVDLFFIISGFLIISLLMQEKAKFQRIDIKAFYFRRLLRIAPLYYLIIALGAALFYHELNQVDLQSFLLFYGNFSLITQNAWTLKVLNPLWTICVEMQFYLLIPWLVSIIPLRKLHYLLIGCILMSIAFRLYLYLFLHAETIHYYLHTFSRMDALGLGGLLAYFYYYGKLPAFNPRLTLLIAAVALFVAMIFTSYEDYSTFLQAFVGKYAFVIPLVAIFYAFYLTDTRNWLSHYLKRHELMNYFGKISYGLYMYHSFVIYLLFQYRFIHTSTVYKLVIITSISLSIAAFSYTFFEKKFISLKDQFKSV